MIIGLTFGDIFSPGHSHSDRFPTGWVRSAASELSKQKAIVKIVIKLTIGLVLSVKLAVLNLLSPGQTTFIRPEKWLAIRRKLFLRR
ncbi:MAG: hypothetical protein CTY29_00230 [Methylobacter sp.]|nr:MAG: hypothetical protein CTY29_00230 [Methylobacter sp.]